MAPLLEVENLTVRFPRGGSGAAFPAVEDLSFTIGQGEALGLVGESGSGKSVTSLAILRLLPPGTEMSGSIRLDGVDLLRLPEGEMRARRGRDIAMVFQEPMTALNPVMRIGDQIAEAVRVHHPKLSRTEVQGRVLAALESVALPDPARRVRDYPHQFSGGQRQRIMIAMAVVNRPRLLIADEPTTALDVTVQAQVLDLLRAMKEQYGLSMLFISHDLAVTARVTQRVAVMQRGRMLESAPVDRLFRSPEHPYTATLLAAVPTMHTDRDRPLATVTRS